MVHTNWKGKSRAYFKIYYDTGCLNNGRFRITY
jgi:hypothetical protein